LAAREERFKTKSEGSPLAIKADAQSSERSSESKSVITTILSLYLFIIILIQKNCSNPYGQADQSQQAQQDYYFMPLKTGKKTEKKKKNGTLQRQEKKTNPHRRLCHHLHHLHQPRQELHQAEVTLKREEKREETTAEKIAEKTAETTAEKTESETTGRLLQVNEDHPSMKVKVPAIPLERMKRNRGMDTIRLIKMTRSKKTNNLRHYIPR